MNEDNTELQQKMQILIAQLEKQLEKSKELDQAIVSTLESLKNGKIEISNS